MKRLCGFLCVTYLCEALRRSTITGSTQPSDIIIQTIGLVAVGCLGLSAAETISKTISDNKKKETITNEP